MGSYIKHVMLLGGRRFSARCDESYEFLNAPYKKCDVGRIGGVFVENGMFL